MSSLLRLIAIALLLSGCASPAPQDPAGRIWSTSEQRFVSETELLERLTKSDVVLLGEQHDDPHHHLLQARVLRELAARGERPAVVFEMLASDQQAAVDAARRTQPNTVDALAEAVDWADSGWPAWSLYRPVFAAAYAHDLEITAGNLAHARVRQLATEGRASLSPAEAKALGLDFALASEQALALAQNIRESHCDLLPEAMIPGMALAQRARDGALARAILDAASAASSAVVITGSGHARTDYGIPWVLRQWAPTTDVVSLSFQAANTLEGEADDGMTDGAYPFDYVWITPARETADHCAALRERFAD